MVKVKVSEFAIENQGIKNQFPDLEIRGLLINSSRGDTTFSESSIKSDHIMIMSETEYREKINAKHGRKSNPLMMNFEEYD